jgi:hypothetical protein
MAGRRAPGEIRDAIVTYLRGKPGGARVGEIVTGVSELLDSEVSPSSVRSYLRLNDGTKFQRVERGRYRLVDRQ